MKPVGDLRHSLGEGPGYDPVTDTTWWLDIDHRKLMTMHTDGEAEVHDLPFTASAMAPTTDGRWLLVAEDGLYFRNAATGALTLHLPLEADNAATRSNDARVHPCGAFWIGTMGWSGNGGQGAIYHYLRGKLTTLFTDISITNAICFSPDGATAYFTDTAIGKVMKVATDPASGLPSGEPEVLIDRLAASPDGAVTDADGNLWIALWGGWGVAVYDRCGVLLRIIDIGAPHVSCPAFIGPRADRLLVTSATLGLDAATIARAPLSGATFIGDAHVNGRHDPAVRVA